MSRSLEEFLEDNALAVLPTPPDGACFFHALKMMLELPGSAADIRRDVVNNIGELMDKRVQDMALVDGGLESAPPVAFSTILDNKYGTWENYFIEMAKHDEYADDPCIWSAVMLYDVKIVVYVTYESDERVRVFEKMESWGMGETSKTISIGNYAMVHFVATASVEDDTDDLEDLLLGDSVDIIPLMNMFNQTFAAASPLVGFTYDTESLVNASGSGAWQAFSELRDELGDDIRGVLENYVKDIQAEYDNGEEMVVQRKLDSLIEGHYSRSPMGADEYNETYPGDYEKYAAQLFKYWLVGTEGVPKVVVDVEKKGRLLSILSIAIKIGLNYQMLTAFNVKYIPKTYELDDDDMEVYFGDRVVPMGYKKVKMSDLSKSPYWEGIRVVPDLGDYVSVEVLQSLKTDQLVNMVKRTTLYRIYSVDEEYRLNLDKASPDDLKQLCQLKTLELAPDVHVDACRHFQRGTGMMEDRYASWLTSNRSFKPYRTVVKDSGAFITLPEVPFAPETTVNDVLDDLSLLPSLLIYRNHDNHDSESLKNGPLPLLQGPSDASFASLLSRAFVDLGVLPEGFERYCGVKMGDSDKRSLNGSSSRAKRPRKLFIPTVSVKC